MSGLIAIVAAFGTQANTVHAGPELNSKIVPGVSDRLPPMEPASTTASRIVIPESESLMLAQLTTTAASQPVQSKHQSPEENAHAKVVGVSVASSQAQGSGGTGSIVTSERAARTSATDAAAIELRRERTRSHAELLSATPWTGNAPSIPFSNTLWLIGTGMIGLALIARRRNRKL